MTYRVEITVTRDDECTSWTIMLAHGGLGPLAGITRDEAVDRASRLPRYGGRYFYRVRLDR